MTKEELLKLDRNQLTEAAEKSSDPEFVSMMKMLSEQMTEEMESFVQGKKVAGARSRKISCNLQALLGLWRKRSVKVQAEMKKVK